MKMPSMLLFVQWPLLWPCEIGEKLLTKRDKGFVYDLIESMFMLLQLAWVFFLGGGLPAAIGYIQQ